MTTKKAKQRRSNFSANSHMCDSCQSVKTAEKGDVYRVSGTEVYRIAQGLCTACAKSQGVPHHLDITKTEAKKVPEYKAPETQKSKIQTPKAPRKGAKKAKKGAAAKPAPRKAKGA